MKITWLGQAGLLFDNGKTVIMIDPYLSDSVQRIAPNNYRRVPIKREIFETEPDVMIFTHDHLDHYDPETASVFLGENRKPMTVLCPSSVWSKARGNGKRHNYVQFNRNTEWTEHGFRFSAVKAEHSDSCAVGVVIEDLSENKIYYITGDTLYNSEIFGDLPDSIDAVFLPLNGVGNNMNMTDAARFAKKCGAKHAVPIHFGMFDEIDPRSFEYDKTVIPAVWEKINF